MSVSLLEKLRDELAVAEARIMELEELNDKRDREFDKVRVLWGAAQGEVEHLRDANSALLHWVDDLKGKMALVSRERDGYRVELQKMERELERLEEELDRRIDEK